MNGFCGENQVARASFSPRTAAAAVSPTSGLTMAAKAEPPSSNFWEGEWVCAGDWLDVLSLCGGLCMVYVCPPMPVPSSKYLMREVCTYVCTYNSLCMYVVVEISWCFFLFILLLFFLCKQRSAKVLVALLVRAMAVRSSVRYVQHTRSTYITPRISVLYFYDFWRVNKHQIELCCS